MPGRTELSAIISAMILVTGGTGFVGSALIRALAQLNLPVRVLLRPSPVSPNIPQGVPVEVAVSSLNDERGLRAAMKGIQVVFHLAGSERLGSHADLTGVDIQGTEKVARAASQAGVSRIFYLSHLGADRSSAYPVLKAKAIAEHMLIESRVPYTIFRSGPIFGPGDQFTTQIASLVRWNPLIFLLPGDGNSVLQPIWVEDVISCLTWALDEPATINQRYSIGGIEYLKYRDVVQQVMHAMGTRRFLIPASPAVLQYLALLSEQILHRFPVSIYWLDQLATDRTCPVDTLPRLLGLMPERMNYHLDYLARRKKR